MAVLFLLMISLIRRLNEVVSIGFMFLSRWLITPLDNSITTLYLPTSFATLHTAANCYPLSKRFIIGEQVSWSIIAWALTNSFVYFASRAASSRCRTCMLSIVAFSVFTTWGIPGQAGLFRQEFRYRLCRKWADERASKWFSVMLTWHLIIWQSMRGKLTRF